MAARRTEVPALHRKLAAKAAAEAARVLPLFERQHPADPRPRQAITAIAAWAAGRRELDMRTVRRLALGAHAAARVSRDAAARHAARAAGHAVATWHAATHALAAAGYAAKAGCARDAERLATRRGARRPARR